MNEKLGVPRADPSFRKARLKRFRELLKDARVLQLSEQCKLLVTELRAELKKELEELPE